VARVQYQRARAHSVTTELDLRSAARFGEKRSLEDWVKCGITSEIPRMEVLTPFPCSEGLGETQSLKLRDLM
jgi:hypothetical protein